VVKSSFVFPSKFLFVDSEVLRNPSDRKAQECCSLDKKMTYKDYNYNEWINLSPDLKRKIINEHWTPFDKSVGESTRSEILKEFIKTVGNNFYICEFGYFAHYLIGIKYLPKDSFQKVVTDFNGIVINKGKIKERLDSNKIKVKWRHSGTEIITLI
jgi:hypothetical protein